MVTTQTQEAKKFILDEVARLPSPLLWTCKKILNDDRFFQWPASLSKHQVFVGGLAAHTSEVLRSALAMCDVKRRANRNVVIVACLFHDYGKIWDYELTNYALLKQAMSSPWDLDYPCETFLVQSIWKKASHRDLIRHPSRSYHEFLSSAEAQGVDGTTITDISHCILSHHGRKEWDATVEPKTPEAWIVHFADMLDSHCE